MHKILSLIIFLLLIPGAILLAQIPQKLVIRQLPVRRVNGVVRDSLGRSIPAAAVRLTSSKDTLHVVTSEYGVFNFPAVRSESFTIEVQVMSYRSYRRKYFLNDTRPILVLPPVVMGSSLVQLKEVSVTTAKGPQERGDTTEFWAKDYIVRDYARLEDMLKRMEGFNADANGQLTYRGKPISRALFNGAKYFDGDIAAAIKELPADIVERIQVIQDNESGTGRRLSASEASSQTLNVVTKADKSAGRMYQVNAEGGTQDRYRSGASARSIDGWKQWSLSASANQAPLGIMSTEPIGTISGMTISFSPLGNGGSGGMRKDASAQVHYGNTFGKLNFGVDYNIHRVHSVSEAEEFSEEFYKEGSLRRNTKRTTDNKITSHIVTLSASANKGDFSMMVTATASMSHNENKNNSETRQSGILENLQRMSLGTATDMPSYNLYTLLAFFTSRKVHLNITVSSSSSTTKGSGNDNTDTYGADITKPDSSLYLLQQQNNNTLFNAVDIALTHSWRNKLTFLLKVTPSIRKSTDINYRDQVIPGQEVKRLNDLSNDNMLTGYRLPASFTVTYDYHQKISVEVGGRYEINWQHMRLPLKELDLSTRTGTFLPAITVKYMPSTAGNLLASYNRDVNLPTLLQLNTKPYYVTPFDVVIGNKNLANGLIDNWRLRGTYMFAGTGIFATGEVAYSQSYNSVGANRMVRIDTVTKTIRTETYYLNMKGGNNKNLGYSLSKNLPAMNTTLKLDGYWSWGKQLYFADGSLETTLQRNWNQSIIASFSPWKWLDIATALAYRSDNNENSLQPGRPLYNNEFNAVVKGAVFFPADIKFNVSARQNILRASSYLVNQHPLVINANIEKRFLKKKDAIISFVVMDALQQNNNNMIAQTVTGYSNAVSSTKSRYFLLQLAWYPQQFTRSKSAKNARRGDGSFVQ
ncbi:outer membrane beta-barrel protein [Chitinophaga polysaccharea]|uniref:outer membrane beta-barrel protein n=1 Tax=Chitinophaga polysaccharea TaxID=1293035 RepID=UPI001454FD2C|nr:outer membrane beta-barrel protein [Chitinophaga polysaccharea]NLR58123.1 outer membrane beta-barrel protein [Chitinophaga polysaccharea]